VFVVDRAVAAGARRMPRENARVASSPPTQRVVRILNLLAREPEERLSASVIARRLDLNLATCQAILASLTETGFVVRSSEDRTFTLGPALVRLGEAARSLNPALTIVGEALERIHAETGYACAAAVVRDGHLIVARRVGSHASFPVPALADGAWPLSAPIGITTMAWRSNEEVRAWFEGSPRADDAEYRARLPLVLESIRATGACVWRFGSTAQLLLPQFETLIDAVGEGHDAGLVAQLVQRLAFAGTEAYLPEELDAEDRLAVGLITAPVWGFGADPSIEISVHVYRDAMPAPEARALARRVAQVRTEVTTEM
jgi:DNA-binding IclR family transcriptional regulator